MEPSIGIKIADGTFYPILKENSGERKRLVLTTVKDNQENVQIDIYRSSEKSLQNADYLGTLLIEDIPPSPMGEPDVEVFIQVDSDGNLHAVASESTTGNRQSLSTSLENLEEETAYSMPDFTLDEEKNSFSTEDELTGEAYPIEAEDRRKTRIVKTRNPLLRILFIIAGLLAIAAVTYLIFMLVNQVSSNRSPNLGRASPQAVTSESSPSKESERGDQEVSDSEITPERVGNQDKAQPVGETPPVSGITDTADTADTTEKKSVAGLWYTIKWGDTLWDISATYYRDPWKYRRIAEDPRNQIKNPDYILAGFKLYIPRE